MTHLVHDLTNPIFALPPAQNTRALQPFQIYPCVSLVTLRDLTHAPYNLCVTQVTHHWHVRELTHARWPVVRAEEQTFFGR